MNGVLSLCHFCELHGPKVLFTCQPFREDEDGDHLLNAESPDSGHDDGAAPAHLPPPSVLFTRRQSNSEERKFYGNYAQLLNDQTDERRPEEECAACTSIGGWAPGFLSNDHAARTSYVSSELPYDAVIRELVRQACLRSLSCEVCPGKEGAVFFGDVDHGYTLSHTFTLRDARARGFQHLYSLVVVSMDKLLLLNYQVFLVNSLRAVIDKLQAKANSVFEQEQAESELRLATASRAAMLPQGFLKTRSSSGGSVRSLKALTGDNDIFHRLHRYLVWILRSQTLQCVELVLEGSPSQDVLVSLEQAEEQPEMAELSQDDIAQQHQIEHDSSGLQRAQFFTTTQESNLSELNSLQSFSDLQCIARRLGPERYRRVLYHLLVGDQLIVRSESHALSQRLLEAFSCVLPRGCVKLRASSPAYEEIFRFNLLGLGEKTSIPEDGDTQLVTVCAQLHPSSWDDSPLDLLDRCSLKVEAVQPLPALLPSLVDRIVSLTLDESLSAGVFEAVMRAAKEEWLNKAKLFECMKQQQLLDEPMGNQNLKRLFGILKCSERDSLVLKFWQGGLSKHCKEQVRCTISRLKGRIS